MKRMPAEHAEHVGLSTTKEMERFMLEAVDRFWSEAETRFKEISVLNETNVFLIPMYCCEVEGFRKI